MTQCRKETEQDHRVWGLAQAKEKEPVSLIKVISRREAGVEQDLEKRKDRARADDPSKGRAMAEAVATDKH